MRLTVGFAQLMCRWSAGGDSTHTHVYTDSVCFSSWKRRNACKGSSQLVISWRKSISDSLWSSMVLTEDFPMIEVSIPSMEREVDESGKSKKLFRVEVLFNERKHFVLRRSSEFQTLHRKLRKIIQTPDFPSKRNPHLRTKPMEQRRQELEDYIQVTHPGVHTVRWELLQAANIRQQQAAAPFV
uniref:PX domain-containing protein n=1 Tax=Sparus aurata TaxID=8175 RepID=A0A671WY86_SPAAU